MATRYKVVLYPEYASGAQLTGFQQPVAPGSVKLGSLSGNDLGDKDYNQKNAVIQFYVGDADNVVTIKTLRETGTAAPRLRYFPNQICASEVDVTLTQVDGITYTVDNADIANAIKAGVKDLLHFELTI